MEKGSAPVAKRVAVMAGKMFAILLLSVCLGIILLYAVYLLPTGPMGRNLERSAPIFQREGSYPKQLSWCSSTLDNFTDALMLLTAAYGGEGPTLDKAMSLYYELPTEQEPGATKPVQSVLEYGLASREVSVHRYIRYWGGYLIFLKPLLSIMNYQQIRILNQLLQTGVVLLLVFLLKRAGHGRFILPLLLALGLLPVIVNAQSLTYSDVFYLSMGGSCVLILKWDSWRDPEKPMLFFFILGILTSFFDFLTYPLVSFGIPICLYFCMERDTDLWHCSKTLFLSGFAWGLGYGGMWSGKWAAASILTGSDVLEEALSSVLFRSGSTLEGGGTIRLLDTILRNVGEWGRSPVFILFWLVCFAALVLLIKEDKFEVLKENLIFLPIACLPFVWYAVVRNHSYIHYFFTYKELVIFAFAMMCFFVKSLPGPRGSGSGCAAKHDIV